jgi:hypothetical protein
MARHFSDRVVSILNRRRALRLDFEIEAKNVADDEHDILRDEGFSRMETLDWISDDWQEDIKVVTGENCRDEYISRRERELCRQRVVEDPFCISYPLEMSDSPLPCVRYLFTTFEFKN